MSKKKIGLGKGLGALLGDVQGRIDAPTPTAPELEIPLDRIETNPFQPRKDFDEEALEGLAESIRVHGIIQPITVRSLGGNRYQLIAGERRYTASKRAGLVAIPAHVRAADDQDMLEMALIENIQREDLNPIEVALSYQRLISEIHLKQEELGERVGKKRATVTNYLRLLRLPPSIQAALRDHKISMGHARALVNAGDIDAQLHIFNQIVEKSLSVRQAEELVSKLQDKAKQTGAPSEVARQDVNERAAKAIQSKLATHFGTKVNVKSRGQRGEIRIPFFSSEDLDRILGILHL